MTLRAAFFDVGDTLVEHWAPRELLRSRMREQVCAELGEQAWLDDLMDAHLEPGWSVPLAKALAARDERGDRFAPQDARQETLEWIRAWFQRRGLELDGLDLDRLRVLMCVPLRDVSTPVRGALDTVRWCSDRGLRVVLVTNTLSRGDAEVLDDWRCFGLEDAVYGVVSSHSARWRKPHPAIFERALEIADARPEEAFHVGDNLIADVWGAQQIGMRGIWRRSDYADALAREGDVPSSPWRERRRRGPESCEHPSEDLFLRDGTVMCGGCGAPAGIRVRPDAIVRDLTEIPSLVERGL
ncbi:MAG: HAD family hydrolase [Chloroflexota bacterium]|nr:HAD family hydrolase [Chloroflexota bacterium]